MLIVLTYLWLDPIQYSCTLPSHKWTAVHVSGIESPAAHFFFCVGVVGPAYVSHVRGMTVKVPAGHRRLMF